MTHIMWNRPQDSETPQSRKYAITSEHPDMSNICSQLLPTIIYVHSC